MFFSNYITMGLIRAAATVTTAMQNSSAQIFCLLFVTRRVVAPWTVINVWEETERQEPNSGTIRVIWTNPSTTSFYCSQSQSGEDPPSVVHACYEHDNLKNTRDTNFYFGVWICLHVIQVPFDVVSKFKMTATINVHPCCENENLKKYKWGTDFHFGVWLHQGVRKCPFRIWIVRSKSNMAATIC